MNALLLALLAVVGTAAGAEGQRPVPPFYQSVAWTEDGRHLVVRAVMSDWAEGMKIYSMNLDGSGLKETGGLFAGVIDGKQPSPDGRSVLSFRRTGASDTIYVANPDGSGERAIAHGFFPTWTPDGRHILFCATDGEGQGSSSLFIIGADGSGKEKLAERVFYAAMSPDGQWIAALSQIAGTTPKKYVIDLMSADGKMRMTIRPTRNDSI